MSTGDLPVERYQWKVKYYIGGVNISTLGIYVKSSDGILDIPKRKIPYRHDWVDEDGEEVDLSSFKKEARTFTLDCFVKGESITEAIDNLQTLFNLLDVPGPVDFEVHYYSPIDKLTFQVFREEEVKVKKAFRYRKNIWTFQLKLKEYIP